MNCQKVRCPEEKMNLRGQLPSASVCLFIFPPLQILFSLIFLNIKSLHLNFLGSTDQYFVNNFLLCSISPPISQKRLHFLCCSCLTFLHCVFSSLFLCCIFLSLLYCSCQKFLCCLCKKFLSRAPSPVFSCHLTAL